MPKYIDTPGGIAEFPDEMDDSAIQSVLQQQFPKPDASAVKGLVRTALGQQFKPPAMPKPPDPAAALRQPKVNALAPLPNLPKPALPFGLRARSPREEAELAGMGGIAPADVEGARRMAESQAAGAREAIEGTGQLFGSGQPLEKRILGASRMYRGGMQAAAPVLAPAIGAAALAAPAATAWGMLAGTAAQEGAERGLKAMGVPEGYARAAGDIAGLPGYAYGPFRALRPKVPTGVADDLAKVSSRVVDNPPTSRLVAAEYTEPSWRADTPYTPKPEPNPTAWIAEEKAARDARISQAGKIGERKPTPANAAPPAYDFEQLGREAARKLYNPDEAFPIHPGAGIAELNKIDPDVQILDADRFVRAFEDESRKLFNAKHKDRSDQIKRLQEEVESNKFKLEKPKSEYVKTEDDLALDELLDSRLRGVLPDNESRADLVGKISETDIHPDWRAASHNKAFDAIFGPSRYTKANKETEFARVANLAMEVARRENPEAGTFAEIDFEYQSRPAKAGPYPSEQGIALMVRGNPSGWNHPSYKTFERARDIYDAITAGQGPKFPMPRRDASVPWRPSVAPRGQRAILDANAPAIRDVPEPPRNAAIRPDPADVAPQPKPADTSSTRPAVDPVATIRELQGDDAAAPVTIAKAKAAGLSDQQIIENLGPGKLIPHESHLHPDAPEVKANPERFLVTGGKAYAVVVPDAPAASSRRETQRGSFSRRPVSEGASPEEMRGTYEQVKKPQGPEDDFLNFGRIKVTPDEEQSLRQTMRGMIDRGELTKDVEPHAAIIQAAKDIHPDLVREVSAEAAKDGLTTRGVMLAARERQNALNREIGSHIKQRLDPNLDMSQRAELDSKIAAMEQNLNEYLKITSGIRTNFGRNLASLKIMADNTLDFGTWMYKVAKAKALPDPSMVPDKDRQMVRDFIARAEEAAAGGDSKAANDAKIGLARFVSKQQETGWLDTISALRKAGLLTGIKTHARNIGGNTAFAAVEEASRIPAAFVDMVLSVGTGRRTVSMPSVSGLKNSVMEAATRGVREAGEIMSKGATEADLAKGDMPRELNFQKLRRMVEDRPDDAVKRALGRTNDAVNTYVNTVFRALGAEDKVFRVYAMRRAIEAQARVIATNEARAGSIAKDAVKSRARELASNPTDLMLSEATAYSEFATFNSKNAAAQFVSRGKAALPPSGRFILDQIVPFVNTPTEVVARGTNYLPGTNFIPAARKALAGANELSAAKQGMRRGQVSQQQYAALRDLVGARNQRAVSEAIGRGTVGTAIMMAGYLAAKEGRATGLREERDPMRTVKQAAGQQDGSVLVNGKWRQVSSVTPTATLFLLGASMYDQSTKKVADEAKRPWMMAGAYGKAIADTPMLQGMSMVSDALKDPARFGEQVVSQQAGSFVPTAVSDASRIADPNRKEYRPPEGGVISPAIYGIQGRVPFWRSSQPNTRDIFGRDVGGSRTYPIDPFASSEAKGESDKMLKMLLKEQVGIKPIDKFKGESSDHYRARSALAGAAMERALRKINPGSLPADPKQREKRIKAAISLGRKQARTLWNDPKFLNETEQRRTEIMENIAKGIRQ